MLLMHAANNIIINSSFLQVKVMAKQLLLFHTAVSAYFSGNQEALEESMKQFNNKVQLKNPPSSWIEQ